MIKSLDQIDWFSVQEDGLGDLYEGLLEKTPPKLNPEQASTLPPEHSSTA